MNDMTSRLSSRPPTSWILPGVVALAAATLILVVVSYLGLSALLSARALTEAESVWIRNQKDLVVALERYARTGGAGPRATAQQAFAFFGATDDALEALTQSPPDPDRVMETLLEVPGFAEEAKAFARFFHWFGWTPHAVEVLEYWQAAQARAREMESLARDLWEAVDQGADEAGTDLFLALEALDREVDRLRAGFDETQLAWARAVHRAAFLTLAATALILLALGSLAIVHVLRRLSAQGRELFHSERRFRQVTDAITEVFWLSSLDKSQMHFVSPAFQSIWGLPAEDLYRRPSLWLEAVHPEDRPQVEAALPLQARGEYDLEYRILTGDGQTRWIRDRAFPVMGRNSVPNGIAGIASDVTEEKRLQRELMESHRVRGVARLAAGVAHDFNNLLTAVRGHLQFLDADLPPDSGAREDVDGIRRATRKAEALTRELLALGRQHFVRLRAVDLNEMLEAYREELESLLPDRITLALEPGPDLPLAWADPEHLRECLVATVANARNAIRGSGKVWLRTRFVPPSEAGSIPLVRGQLLPAPHVALEVRDHGRGIPEDRHEELFEPFFTGPTVGGSNEMGLPAVLGLMEQMMGGIHLQSRPGAGTRVVLLLRVEPVDPEGTPGAAPG